jgi:hypothetical protein
MIKYDVSQKQVGEPIRLRGCHDEEAARKLLAVDDGTDTAVAATTISKDDGDQRISIGRDPTTDDR